MCVCNNYYKSIRKDGYYYLLSFPQKWTKVFGRHFNQRGYPNGQQIYDNVLNIISYEINAN